MADSDFSLSASLNIQKVDVSEVKNSINALSKSGIEIPLVFDPKSIKNIPKNFKVNLVINNAKAIKTQMEEIFSVSSVIEGLGAVVKAEVGAIRKVAAEALRENQAKLDPRAIEKEALKRAKKPNRLKAGEGFGDSKVDFNSVKARNKLLDDANKQEVDNLRRSAAQILEIRRKNAAAILDLQDLINSARQTRVPDGGRGTTTGPLRFFQKSLNELLKVNGATKEQLEERKRLNSQLKKLKKDEERFSDTGARKGLKENRANQRETLGLISKNEAAIAARSIEGLEKVVDQFAGTTGNSADNLRGSLNTLFTSLNSLRQLEEDYKIEEIVDPKVITKINNAKKEIIALLQSVDSSNLATLRSQIETDIVGPLRKQFKSAQRIAGDFTKEINKLLLARASAVSASGGNQDTELVRNIEAQIEILKETRKKGGTSFPDFLDADANSDRALGDLRQRQIELENLEKRANAADLALEKAFSVRTQKGINTTEAAELLDSIGQIEKIATNANDKLEKLRLGGSGVRQNDASVIGAEVEQNIRAVEDRVVFLNKALNDLDSTKLKFDNDGLTSSLKRLGLLREEVIRLVQSGKPLEEVAAIFQEDLVKLEILKSGEVALKNYNGQLDKLQQKLESGARSADLFGAATRLGDGRKELQNGFNAGDSEKQMDLIVKKTELAVSASVKLNDQYASLSANFEKSAAKARDLFDKNEFADASAAFTKYAEDLAKEGKPAEETLRLLRVRYAELNAEAQRNIKLPPTLDKIFETLESQREGFLSKGQNTSAKSINNVIKALQKMDDAGESIEAIQKRFQQGLVETKKVNEDEKAIERYVIALKKLNAANDPLEKGNDFFGVSKLLNKSIAEFENQTNAGQRKSDLTTELASITAQVKARQRLNTTVTSLIDKFDDLGAAQTNTQSTAVYQTAQQDFLKYVNTVTAGGGDINAQLRAIQSEFIRTRTIAAIKAEGGFLGSIAKLAGLATKRLLAFVGIARITFAIQQAFTDAVRAGLELEVQTNKLEQVFSKTFTTEKSLAAATKEVTDEIFKMSQGYGVAVGEVTQAARILAQAGFSGQALVKSIDAISKANLTATFNDINETTEASVAILNQFKLEADQLEASLGGINRVSSLYAVESEGIAKAVRKAGGAFRAAGGSLDEFVGAFTIMKKETREADEALATGLRNIAIRIQRAAVQNKVGGLLGINFKDERGQFIGITDALTAVSSKLRELNVNSRDPRFSQVVESLAGARQFARLIPLLQQFEELNDISSEFTAGAGSLDDDASRALTTINNKMEQLRATFAELSQAVLTSDLFKTLLDSVNLLAKGFNAVVKAVGNMNVLLLAAAGIALPKIITSGLAFRFLSGAGADPTGGLAGLLTRRNTGGIIPGRGANRDTVPALLTRGEYVIQRDAVDKYGVSFFDKLNSKRASKPAGFNRGGRVGYNTGGGVGGNINDILKQFGMELKDGGKGIVKAFEIVSDEIMRKTAARRTGRAADEIRPKAARGVFNNRTKAVRVNELLEPERKKFTSGHELTHAIDTATNRSSTSRKEKQGLIDSAKGTQFEKHTKSRTKDASDKEVFADLGAFSLAQASRDLGEGGNEPKEIRKVLDNLTDGELAALRRMYGFLEKSGLKVVQAFDRAAQSTSKLPVFGPSKAGGGLPVYGESQSGKGFRLPSALSPDVADQINKKNQESIDKLSSSRPKPQRAGLAANTSIFNRLKQDGIAARGRNATELSPAALQDLISSGRNNGGRNNIPPTVGGTGFPTSGSGGGRPPKQITNLISSLGPITPLILKWTSSLGAGTAVLSTFANITENAALKTNDWASALAAGAATYFTTITLFKTLNGVLATANLRLAAQNAKGFIKDFRGGFKSTSNPIKGSSSPSSLANLINPNKPGVKTSASSLADLIGGKKLSTKGAAIGRIAGKIPGAGLISKIPSNSIITKGLSLAGKGLTRFGSLLAGSGGVLAPVVAGFGALTVVTKALGSAAAANAQEMLNEAKTREEAAEALDKFDFADRLLSGFGVFTAINNAGQNALVYLKGFGEGLFNVVPGLSTVTDKISGLGSLLGSLLPESEKVISEQKSRRSLSAAKFDLQDVDQSIGGLASKDDAKRATAQSGVKKGLGTAAKNILDGIAEGASAQGISFSEFAKQDPKIVEDLRDKVSTAIKNGVKFNPEDFADIQKAFNIAGLKFDPKSVQRAVTAIDNMSLLFLRLETITEQAANRMTAVEGNLSKFDQTLDAITGQSFNFQIPDQVFDLVSKGIDPASLGLDEFSARIKAGLNSVNPAEAVAFNLEFGAEQLSRKLNEGLAATGDKITFDPNQGGVDGGGISTGQAIADELIVRAGRSSSGAVLQAYDDFMTSKAEEFAEQAQAEGTSGIFTLTADAITALNKEFADAFKKGAIENLKKRFQIESDFTSRYAAILSKRFELENQFIDRFSGVVDKEKSIAEFQNKLTRPEGEDTSLNGRQASFIDQRRLGNSLRGTGLSGRSSVDDIRAAFRESQSRLQQFSTGRDRSGNVIDPRTRTLGAQQETQVQQRLTTALELLAAGGEKGEAAMRAFEKASEQAQKSSEAFLNTFLGSDEDLLNAGRAASLFSDVIKANASGGTFAAKETLRGADQSTRQALDKLISENTQMRTDLMNAIGVSGSAVRSPEASAVQGNLAEQLKAQRALAETTQRQIASMDGLASVLSSQENGAIQMMTNQINQAAVVANDMTKNLANIPTEIDHTHKVADINVNFVGAGNLSQLQEGFKNVIISTIKEEIANSTARLRRANPNLNPF